MKYQVEVTPYEAYSSYYVYFDTEKEAKEYARQFQMSLTKITEVEEG